MSNDLVTWVVSTSLRWMFGSSKLCQPQNLLSQWRSCRTGRPAMKFHRRCSCQTFILVPTPSSMAATKKHKESQKSTEDRLGVGWLAFCWSISYGLPRHWTAKAWWKDTISKRKGWCFKHQFFFRGFVCSFESFQGLLTRANTNLASSMLPGVPSFG